MAVDYVIVDTGAADTIIDIIAVEPLQLAADEDDVIVRMAGLGGDYAVRKSVDTLTFAGYTLMRPSVDFRNLVVHLGIYGLLGMDILLQGQCVIDTCDDN